jgi:SAM-dependent methyltransferase
MRNEEHWKPSKYVQKRGKLIASRDPGEVWVGSRLVADTVAGVYAREIPRHTKGRLLDLGCGNVPLYGVYKPYVTHVTCADWANTRHKNAYLDCEIDLTNPLPFGDGEFDTILLSDVLEHLPEPANLWREMTRVLADDGVILLNVPFYYWLHEQPFDFYRYTEFALRRFAQGAGLTVVELEAVGGAPEVVADVIAKVALLLPVRFERLKKYTAIATQALCSAFLRTRIGRKLSNATRSLFPLGYFMVVRKPTRSAV